MGLNNVYNYKILEMGQIDICCRGVPSCRVGHTQFVSLTPLSNICSAGVCGCSRRFEDQQATVKGREDIKLARGLELTQVTRYGKLRLTLVRQ
jgi:hypothetical protein